MLCFIIHHAQKTFEVSDHLYTVYTRVVNQEVEHQGHLISDKIYQQNNSDRFV